MSEVSSPRGREGVEMLTAMSAAVCERISTGCAVQR